MRAYVLRLLVTLIYHVVEGVWKPSLGAASAFLVTGNVRLQGGSIVREVLVSPSLAKVNGRH